MKKIFKDFSYSVLANGVNMLISLVLVLFVPKVLGVKEYSYWQLYLFYASYVGFFHFGWADGVYLRFGGKKYAELDKRYFHTQFWLLTFMEIIIAVAIGAAAVVFIPDANKEIALIATGLCCIVQLPRTFLQYILQSTDKIANYAKNFLLEKMIYAILVIGLLVLGVKDFKVLIGADLIARGFTLVLLLRECKDIVKGKAIQWKAGIQGAWQNISVGSKLMFSSIASMLLTGIVRFAIENQWSVEVFGRVSLTITASNLLMIFINAVSIVMYPVLKNLSEDRYTEVYKNMRNMLMIPVLGLLIVYYPAKVILSWWLPQYAESLRYMALLFPMCVFESKMSMLVNTYFKALRKEKEIMKINWIMLGVTAVLTGITAYGLHNLTLAIATLPVVMGLRCLMGELYLSQKLHMKVAKENIMEIGLAFIFIVASWLIESWVCTAIYAAFYGGYLIIKRKELGNLISNVKKVGKK
nr:hypothetical protein [uncultured Sellimonas sp.]